MKLINHADFMKAVIDAFPSPLFVVDEDVGILEYNKAAEALLDEDKTLTLRKKGGDALHCLHAFETPEGCGSAPFCADCVIRNSVGEAFSGRSVVRKKTQAELIIKGSATRIYLLVTVSPFAYENEKLALLVLEDMTETVSLRGLLPICAKCKKIRDDKSYWQKLETYFKNHMDMDFTHGLCPECAEEFMDQVIAQEKKTANN
jgi:hypothetical protein